MGIVGYKFYMNVFLDEDPIVSPEILPVYHLVGLILLMIVIFIGVGFDKLKRRRKEKDQ